MQHPTLLNAMAAGLGMSAAIAVIVLGIFGLIRLLIAVEEVLPRRVRGFFMPIAMSVIMFVFSTSVIYFGR